MRATNKLCKIMSLMLAASMQLTAFAPNNFFKPYDSNLNLSSTGKGKQAFRLAANVEYGMDREGKNLAGKSKNILTLYEETQSFIPALRNAPAGSKAEAAMLALGAPVIDDGTRGHVALSGKFDMLALDVVGRYQLPLKMIPGNLGLSVMLPVRDARVHNVAYTNKTASLTPVDARINAAMGTKALAQATLKGLAGLDLADQSNQGIGDVVVMLDWSNRYEQDKNGLQAVELMAKWGLSMPSASERNEDAVFSVALGNDGAWAMPFGVGLNLDFKYHLRLGVDAQFEVMFDHSKDYRMKTNVNQTRFLLLNKGRASMEHGFTWKFNLAAQAYRFAYGLSLGATYQYMKHDDDRLSPQGNDFDAVVVNSAAWLKEYNAHNLVFKLNWDCGECLKTGVSPQLSLFYKLPVDGKNMMQQDTFGGQLAFNF